MTVLDPRKAPKFTKHTHSHDGHADVYHSDDDHEVDPHHHHHHGPAHEGKVTTKVKLLTLMAVVLPPIALAIAIYYSWGGYFSWTDMAMLVVGYFMTSMGITIGYHRLYTHKSFEASAPVAWVSAVCGSMAVQGPLLWWVTTHRRHHQHHPHHHLHQYLHSNLCLMFRYHPIYLHRLRLFDHMFLQRHYWLQHRHEHQQDK